MSAVDISLVDRAVSLHGAGRAQLLPLLLTIQRHLHYLPPAALDRLSRLTGIGEAEIRGVASFYAIFRFEPMGKHLIKVCDGTACHVKGSIPVYDAIRHHLGIAAGADTDESGRFTVQKVFCLGCCTLAPAVQIDDLTYGHLAPDTIGGMIDDFNQQAKGHRGSWELAEARGNLGEVRICMDSCCIARGCGKSLQSLEKAITDNGILARVRRVSCVVMCERAPMLEVAPAGSAPVRYSGLPDEDIGRVLRQHLPTAGLLHRLRNGVTDALDTLLSWEEREPVERYASPDEAPGVAAFFGPQVHVATEHFGASDPLDLAAYRGAGGFLALERCRGELTPEAIIEEIRASGLRGRGGAGFATARKWEMVRSQPGGLRYVVCNGDEGDPGAFMDRMLMESFPYRVIEGMAIAARAVGANEAFVYVRAEYPFAVERMREAIRRCEQVGLLGGEGLKLRVFEGAGAFVCGEETALIASMEGRRGIPTLRPPYPAEAGLHEIPTLISNVETFVMVPWILREGGAAFARLGTPQSTGTKVFALAGKVARGGLIEVPMGVTIRQIVEEIGGGVPNGKRLKAVLIGGPSGGCVPASMADATIDYESLTGIGAIMGSGGLVVLDEDDCMVSIARYFLDFCQQESCGKCTFCRVGTARMLDILDGLCQGRGEPGDLELLEEMAADVSAGSLCGLGRTAPNPVTTALRHFRAEYDAHLQGHCPAGVCRSLISLHINDRCIGCTLCAQHCPDNAIAMTPYQLHRIDQEACTRCGICRQVCPEDAVEVH